MFSVDKYSFHALVETLEQLEEYEDNAQKWREYEELTTTFETKLPSAIDASTSFRAVSLLTLLKQSSKTLSTLSDIFDKAYSSLRALAMPSILHHGLLSLPPEILSYIAKLTHPSSRRPYPVFSLVCRRFREIELSTPELWKFVNGNMSPERIATQIERGGGVDIAFEIIDGGTDYWRCDCLWRCRCKVWAAFATNADKMTSGRVQLNHGSLTEEMFGTPVMHDPGRPIRADEHILCLHKLRGVTLPRLRSLDLDILREEGHGVSFIRTWTMPKLRHLTFRVMIWDRNPDPSSVLPIPAGTKLESLKLKVSWMSGNAHIGFEWIAQLLKSECLSELTRLELTFVETKRYARPWIVEDQPDAVANMRPRFEPMPSITHLHLSLPNINIASPDSPTPSDVSKLSNSSFLVFLLPHLTTLVPNLESLDVTTPCSIIQHPTFWDYLSSLKSLNKRMKDVRIIMSEPALGVEEGHLGGLIRDCVQGAEPLIGAEPQGPSLRRQNERQTGVHHSERTSCYLVPAVTTSVPIRTSTVIRPKSPNDNVPSYRLYGVGFDDETEERIDYAKTVFWFLPDEGSDGECGPHGHS